MKRKNNINAHTLNSKIIKAAKCGTLSEVAAALNEDIKTINAQDENDDTALMHAICYKHKKIAELIINHPEAKNILNINFKNKQHNTVLIFATIHMPALVEAIIRNYPDIDINITNLEGYTALMYAASNNNLTAVQAILSSEETKVDLVDNDTFKCTALLWAVYRGNPKIVREIVNFSLNKNKNLNVDAQDCTGMTALMLAANLAKDRSKDNIAKACAIVKILLENFPGINLSLNTNDDQYTALMYIADYGNLEMLEAFLEVFKKQGSDLSIINSRDKHGRTALMYSAARGDIEMFTKLSNVPGIDTTAQDEDGKTSDMYYAHAVEKSNLNDDSSISSTSNENSDDVIGVGREEHGKNIKLGNINKQNEPISKYVCINSVKKLMIALEQKYSPTTSTYIDVINASSLTNNLNISPQQLEEINLLIEKRYVPTGGMCKPPKKRIEAQMDKEKLQKILYAKLVVVDNRRNNILTGFRQHTKKKRHRYSEECPSDYSEDEDYTPKRKNTRDWGKSVRGSKIKF